MKVQLSHKYEDIVNIENLLLAWQEFLNGKRGKKDVQEFSLNLMDNVLALHDDLSHYTYKHGEYQAFNISDPKPRNIHKAPVRDRLLHHAIHRRLYPFFDRTFIADSYSCRKDKGLHRAINRFREFSRKVSKNNTQPVYVLQCDIKKFFASIDHEKLLEILKQYIPDEKTIGLLQKIIYSFETKPGTSRQARDKQGLPLGNLTSQLFVNIYMNEFDQFVKHKLKAKHYIRYADDFVLLSESREELESFVPRIKSFLWDKLKLRIHGGKIHILTVASGVDFLGWIHFPDHRIVRTKTRNRMLKRVTEHPEPETLQSYLGLLSHGNTSKLTREVYKSYVLAEN